MKTQHLIDGEAEDFILLFNSLASEAHACAVKKGFWEGDGCSVGDKIALMHSELSETLEAYRDGNPPDDKIPEFSGMEAELADAIIRIMDFGKKHNLRISEAIIAKINYNHTRLVKHGRVNY
jgi:hypothetical protein